MVTETESEINVLEHYQCCRESLMTAICHYDVCVNIYTLGRGITAQDGWSFQMHMQMIHQWNENYVITMN